MGPRYFLGLCVRVQGREEVEGEMGCGKPVENLELA